MRSSIARLGVGHLIICMKIKCPARTDMLFCRWLVCSSSTLFVISELRSLWVSKVELPFFKRKILFIFFIPQKSQICYRYLIHRNMTLLYSLKPCYTAGVVVLLYGCKFQICCNYVNFILQPYYLITNTPYLTR